jgi:hypothetical protein
VGEVVQPRVDVVTLDLHDEGDVGMFGCEPREELVDTAEVLGGSVGGEGAVGEGEASFVAPCFQVTHAVVT